MDPSNPKEETNLDGGDEFVIGDFILSGKLRNSEFSPVYNGLNKNTQETVAVKVVTTKNSLSMKFIEYESRIYRELKSEDYLYKYFKSGTQGKLIYLAIEPPGPTIEELLKRCKGFTIKTIILVTLSLLDIIERLHKRRFL
jgi:serine/threonine protein kinase